MAKKDMSKDGVRKKEGTQEKEHKLQVCSQIVWTDNLQVFRPEDSGRISKKMQS